jgi:ATP-dependent Clp protease ATP-binding subunit ClpX
MMAGKNRIDGTKSPVRGDNLLHVMFLEEVQQALLKLLEVNVPPKGGRKHPDQKFVEVNTQNILFIAGGAFDGIELFLNDLNRQAVGYSTSNVDNDDNLLQYIIPKDIKDFGLIPESLVVCRC